MRAEEPGDAASILAVVSDVFRRTDEPDRDVQETWLVESLRGSDAWIPQLSLVADDDDGGVVGYCLSTRAYVGEVPVLGLGPIGVSVDAQGRGVGTALMSTSIDIAGKSGEPLIALHGDHRYYSRFGFVPASDLGIDAPDEAWGSHFQVLKLPTYGPSIKGPFAYAEPFRRLS